MAAVQTGLIWRIVIFGGIPRSRPPVEPAGTVTNCSGELGHEAADLAGRRLMRLVFRREARSSRPLPLPVCLTAPWQAS
jgi:hypothetical protein